MSDAMDPRHADPEGYRRKLEESIRARASAMEMEIEQKRDKPCPFPIPHAIEDDLRTIIAHGVVTPPSAVDVSAIKQAIQALAYRVANGKLEPCPSCQEHGVPTGTKRYHYDAADGHYTRDCETCHGWTVVTAPGGGPR